MDLSSGVAKEIPGYAWQGEESMSTSRQGLKQRVFHELKVGLICTLYLWAVFGLLVLHKSMILAEHHIDFA